MSKEEEKGEEGNGGKYMGKGNVCPRRKRRGEERKRRTIFGPQKTKRTEREKRKIFGEEKKKGEGKKYLEQKNVWSTEGEMSREGKGGDYLLTPTDQPTNHPNE